MKDKYSNINVKIPLCVDLDGTLIHSDLLMEALVRALYNGRIILRIPRWILQGKAKFKAQLAKNSNLDVKLLPYNKSLLKYLHDQKALGRRLVLVTAANQVIAENINQHLGLFDQVIASSDSVNLRGKEKAKILIKIFGHKQFCYIGNDRTDLHVWKVAECGIIVHASKKVFEKAAQVTRIEEYLPKKSSLSRVLLKELRPYQWVKNLLVFVPIITANAVKDLDAWFYASWALLAFCATASGTYVLNDLLDLDADRSHPDKRNRPLAKGDLSLKTSFILVPILFLIGFFFASLANIVPLVLLYVLITCAYSLKLKEMPLIDLFILASLYTIRLFAGGSATGHYVSLWLLAFSCFLFLGLATIKRVSELKMFSLQNKRLATRRGYKADDLAVIQSIGIASSFASSLVLALYVQSEIATTIYLSPKILWAVVPVMLFWQCRLWLAASRGNIKEDPILYAAKDWVSLLSGFVLLTILAIAHFTFNYF